MDIVQRSVKDLVPYAKNAKKHDQKQVANVAESIRQYGFVQPVVVDRDGVIVIGHCRVLAAKKLGMADVPCVCVDDLTPEQVNALRLVDNKTNESAWDLDLLAESMKEADLDGFDLEWGVASEAQAKKPQYTTPDDVFERFFEDAPPKQDDQSGEVQASTQAQENGAQKIVCPHCGEEINV